MSEAPGTPKKHQPLTLAAMGIQPGRALQVSDGGLEELRRDVQMLMDIEAIKQLKHAYFRCLDTANLEELATLFHDDVHVHFVGGSYEWVLDGKQAYVESIRKSFHRGSVGHHNGHHPEIRILSDSEASGIWYLADHMWMVEHRFLTQGTALYWDRYEKVDGRWLIRDTRYQRIYEMNTLLESEPKFTVHHLSEHGSAAEDASRS